MWKYHKLNYVTEMEPHKMTIEKNTNLSIKPWIMIGDKQCEYGIASENGKHLKLLFGRCVCIIEMIKAISSGTF